MAVNVKLGVDLGGFNSGINAAKAEVKTLDQQMKMIDATFKATGNAEQAMSQKTQTLNKQMDAQKRIATQAEQALKAMTNAGVDPASASYQRMAQELLKAQTGMMNTQVALNGMGDSAQEAAASADNLTNSVQNIGKKISLDQVIGGINTITRGLENAAKKAVELGQKLWDTIMDSAKRADDTVTMAQMYGIDLDTFQRMQKLVAGGLDTSVDAILQSQDKLKKGLGNGTKAATEAMSALGIATKEWVTVAGQSGSSLAIKDSVQLFWEAGQAIMKLGDEYKQESYAQALFGRGWKELVPLFEQYKSLEEYNAALESQTVTTEETIRDLAELNDAVGKLESSWVTLKDELIGAIAPALTDAATAVSGLLDSLTEYLKTPDGKKLLENLGTAVSDMLSGLSKISAEDIVSNFSSLLDSLTKGLDWINQNGATVTGIIEGLGIAFATLTVSSSVLEFVKIIQGLKGLGGGAAAGAAAAKGGGVAAAAGSGVTTGAAAAAAGLLGNPLLQANVPVVGDWFMNNTNVGRALGGKHGDTWESVGNDFEQWQRDTAERIQTFLSDWSHLGDPNYNNGNNQGFTIEPSVEIPPEEKAKIQEQIDAMPPATLKVLVQFTPDTSSLPDGTSWTSFVPGKANGIWDVPYDGYLARLHKGERVMPAREVSSRSFSSNLYVENMNMGGGMSADALAATIAARNRRMMAGYGS